MVDVTAVGGNAWSAFHQRSCLRTELTIPTVIPVQCLNLVQDRLDIRLTQSTGSRVSNHTRVIMDGATHLFNSPCNFRSSLICSTDFSTFGSSVDGIKFRRCGGTYLLELTVGGGVGIVSF